MKEQKQLFQSGWGLFCTIIELIIVIQLPLFIVQWYTDKSGDSIGLISALATTVFLYGIIYSINQMKHNFHLLPMWFVALFLVIPIGMICFPAYVTYFVFAMVALPFVLSLGLMIAQLRTIAKVDDFGLQQLHYWCMFCVIGLITSYLLLKLLF